MVSSVELRRSVRVKRPTVAFAAPVAKRVKIKSQSSTTTPVETMVPSINDSPSTRVGTMASSAAADTAGTMDGTSGPFPMGGPSSTPAPTSEARSIGTQTGTLPRMSDDPPPSGPTDSRDGSDKPLPFGSPPAWCEDRQPLCETLEYYRAFQGSAYFHGGTCYGLLVDFPSTDHQYMDEEVIITQAGGACEMTVNGLRVQAKSQTLKSAQISSFINNMKHSNPVAIIIGSKHSTVPSVMPHRYNVGAFFHVTAIWSEMNRRHVVFMFRLQKINLAKKSWWAAQDSPMPPAVPDYLTKAPRSICGTCGEESPLVYNEGWMCLSYKGCPNLGKVNGQPQPTQLTFNQAFLNERTPWPAGVMPAYSLVPDAITDDPLNEHHSTSVAAWRGFVCPNCNRCNSRIAWSSEVCVTQGCDYSRTITHPVLSRLSVLPPYTQEIYGHAMSHDEYRGHVQPPNVQHLGHWKVLTYKLCDGNYITHFLANKHINARPGGANDVFVEVQKGDGVGLKRPYMKNSMAQGRLLTRHFAKNFGMPYDYVAAADSAPFSNAPAPIMACLYRLIWAGMIATNGSNHVSFNELLAVGYFETMKMNYHDDGEKTLGDLVATWSLGAPGSMFFRIKKAYAHPILNEASYDPTEEVVMGSDYWEERTKLNNVFTTASMDKYEKEKTKVFKDIRRQAKTKAKGKKEASDPDDGDTDVADPTGNVGAGRKGSLAPWCLHLYLRHGDFVVMHGAKIHTAYEHAVVPTGKLRYGMTARYVKPELVDAKEHYRGHFAMPEHPYQGDLDLPIPTI